MANARHMLQHQEAVILKKLRDAVMKDLKKVPHGTGIPFEDNVFMKLFPNKLNGIQKRRWRVATQFAIPNTIVSYDTMSTKRSRKYGIPIYFQLDPEDYQNYEFTGGNFYELSHENVRDFHERLTKEMESRGKHLDTLTEYRFLTICDIAAYTSKINSKRVMDSGRKFTQFTPRTLLLPLQEKYEIVKDMCNLLVKVGILRYVGDSYARYEIAFKTDLNEEDQKDIAETKNCVAETQQSGIIKKKEDGDNVYVNGELPAYFLDFMKQARAELSGAQKAREKASRLEEELGSIKEELERTKREFEKVEAENKDLASQRDEAQQKSDKAIRTVATAQESFQKLREENEKLRKKVEAAPKILKSLSEVRNYMLRMIDGNNDKFTQKLASLMVDFSDNRIGKGNLTGELMKSSMDLKEELKDLVKKQMQGLPEFDRKDEGGKKPEEQNAESGTAQILADAV